MLATQLMVFMRTDLYFVLQDLTGCANLYADGSAYLRYLGAHGPRTGHRNGPNPDPSRAYPRPQRRAVRVYSVVLLAGTAICLGVECAVSLPALIVLLVRAVSEIGVTPVATLDGERGASDPARLAGDLEHELVAPSPAPGQVAGQELSSGSGEVRRQRGTLRRRHLT